MATLTKALQGFGAQVAFAIVVLVGIITTEVYHAERSSIADYVLSIATVALIPPATAMAVVRTLIYDTAFLFSQYARDLITMYPFYASHHLRPRHDNENTQRRS